MNMMTEISKAKPMASNTLRPASNEQLTSGYKNDVQAQNSVDGV
jgi:hypothetical protein